jgi:cyclopropane fatty-acyl-phospholipid synthase-like methyltransferase
MSKAYEIKLYYEPNLEKGLPDHKVLGWESREAQYSRFEILARNAGLKGKKLLDVGCGLGNLLEYLNELNVPVDYTGVDISRKMIESAKRKNLNGTFLYLDIFSDRIFKEEAFDIVYASGIFNLNLGNNKQFLPVALKRFFELSRCTVAFNLLHYKSPDRDDRYFYFSPDEVLEVLESAGYSISETRIFEGYLKNDFTVICRKTAP